MESCR